MIKDCHNCHNLYGHENRWTCYKGHYLPDKLDRTDCEDYTPIVVVRK